jgi:hypothetical protein
MHGDANAQVLVVDELYVGTPGRLVDDRHQVAPPRKTTRTRVRLAVSGLVMPSVKPVVAHVGGAGEQGQARVARGSSIGDVERHADLTGAKDAEPPPIPQAFGADGLSWQRVNEAGSRDTRRPVPRGHTMGLDMLATGHDRRR